MLKSRKGCGIYRDTVNREARDRYADKIGTINCSGAADVAVFRSCRCCSVLRLHYLQINTEKHLIV